MDCSWKANWPETRQHFTDWWHHEGLVLGGWYGLPAATPHAPVEAPPPPASLAARYTDARGRALRNHHRLAHTTFPADVLPVAETDLGPGALGLFLGAEPGFAEHTVWQTPCFQEVDDPEALPPFRFDPEHPWWQTLEAILRACAALGRGRYVVGMPDLVENVDILAALRGTQQMLMDLVDRPAWVEEKVAEINQVWRAAFDRIYAIICLEAGGNATDDFRIWGPGRTAKVQCDAAGMISPRMFERFVVPALREQCRWLDYAVYHVDGPAALRHLDALLALDEIAAVEWTPGAGAAPGGSPEWYGLYRRILEAGKSVQAVDVAPEEVVPLLDAVGGRGVYIITSFADEAAAEAMLRAVEPYR